MKTDRVTFNAKALEGAMADKRTHRALVVPAGTWSRLEQLRELAEADGQDVDAEALAALALEAGLQRLEDAADRDAKREAEAYRDERAARRRVRE